MKQNRLSYCGRGKRIEELESQRHEHEQERAKQQRKINVPTRIWHQLQFCRRTYIKMVVENGKYLRLEPNISDIDNGYEKGQLSD